MTLGITIMLLETKNISNQSPMVIVAWLPELTGHFHVENLKKNEGLIMNKKGYFYSHENITSHAIWNTTISKIVHTSLSKDIKGPMQIKRGKCYSLMLLSKNQRSKHKNQTNKVPTISKQDDIELFSKYICTSFY